MTVDTLVLSDPLNFEKNTDDRHWLKTLKKGQLFTKEIGKLQVCQREKVCIVGHTVSVAKLTKANPLDIPVSWFRTTLQLVTVRSDQ